MPIYSYIFIGKTETFVDKIQQSSNQKPVTNVLYFIPCVETMFFRWNHIQNHQNNCMQKTLFLFLTFFYLHEINSQVLIKGMVKDETGEALPYASISIHTAKDTALIKGNLSDADGNYLIEDVGPGSYRLMCAYLGKENQVSEAFTLEKGNKQASFDFILKTASIALEEATITAKRPFLEQKADKLVVNVANSAIAAGGTAMEILRKVPGVIIIQDKVTLSGSQNVQIWMDGKPSSYTDMNALLRDMPGDQIEKIELITRPGAQYDASGGPIINILLKRNADLGFNGTAGFTIGGYKVDQTDVNGGKPIYGRINPTLNLTYRSGKINLFGNTTYSKGSYYSVIKVNRFIGQEIYYGNNLDETDYVYKNLRLGADYYLTDKTTLGLVLRNWARKGDGESFNNTTVFDPTTQIDAFNTENLTNSKRSGLYGSFSAKHEFDRKTGKQLSFDFDYNEFKSRNINDLAIYRTSTPTLRSYSTQDVDQPVRILVGKMDLALPIDTTFKIESGIKSSYATINNDLNFYRNQKRSEGESNDFLYKENINAAYINANKNILAFEFNAGLRTEQTVINGYSMDQQVLKRNYWQLFPSLSAIYKLTKQLAIQSSYSRRVNRPEFQQQNPFSYFIDSLTYTRGNPKLRPEILNTMQLTLTFENQPFIGISYSKVDDVIIGNAPKLEGTRTYTTAENLAVQNRWEMQLNFPIKFGKYIDGFGGNQAIYNSYDATYLGSTYNASKWNWLAYWQINVSLPAKIKMEVGGYFMTRFLDEFLVIDKIGSLDLGLSKSFMEDKVRVSLSYSDIFYSQNINADIDYGDVQVDFYQREFNRQLRLNMTYKFGNTKMKNTTVKKSASESEASRVKVE